MSGGPLSVQVIVPPAAPAVESVVPVVDPVVGAAPVVVPAPGQTSVQSAEQVHEVSVDSQIPLPQTAGPPAC